MGSEFYVVATFVAGFLSPLLTALFSKIDFPNRIKSYIQLLVAFLSSTAIIYFTGQFNTLNLIVSFGAIYIIGEVMYNKLLQPQTTKLEQVSSLLTLLSLIIGKKEPVKVEEKVVVVETVIEKPDNEEVMTQKIKERLDMSHVVDRQENGY